MCIENETVEERKRNKGKEERESYEQREKNITKKWGI